MDIMLRFVYVNVTLRVVLSHILNKGLQHRKLENAIELFLKNDDELLSWERLQAIAGSLTAEPLLGRSENFQMLWRKLLFIATDLLKSNCFTETWKRNAFEDVFFKGIHSSAFVILCAVFELTSQSYKQDVLLETLENFLKWECAINMLVDQVEVTSQRNGSLWNELITPLVSLPERIANKLKRHNRPFFHVSNYYSRLSSIIVQALFLVHKRLEMGLDSSLEFLSQLIGRLALSGQADLIIRSLTPSLLKLTHKNFLWRKIAQRLFCGIPDRCLESVCLQTLHNIPWYGYVEYFFADQVLSKSVLKFLFTKKFILIRYSDNMHIAENCIGYMAHSSSRRDLLFKMLTNVLDVWGDKSGLVHQSQQQHIYLSSVIMIAIGHLKNMELPQDTRNALQSKLLHGVHSHIACSMSDVRVQGMVVGQYFSEVLDPSGPKLSFEYDGTREIEKMITLMSIPQEPQPDWTEIQDELFSCLEQLTCSEESEKLDSTKNKESVIDNELDSDDDLEPFDLTNDVPNEKQKRPYYVRDCLEGLINNNDADWTEVCLESAKELILSQKHSVSEIAVDLTRVLLNLEDTYATPNFILLRIDALVAVCTQCPKQTANFLTKEFYDSNYNIRQRLDILEVLASASRELTSLQKANSSKALLPTATTVSSEQSWKEIVQKRIEEKTKRISKPKKEMSTMVTENHFGDVAGCFFFPLLQHYDRKANTFDLLGDDHYLLGRLLYTLGIVLNCAANCQIAKPMSRALLEFIWVLRYHTERFVRQALLFASAMVMMNIPAPILVSEFEGEMLECQQWLQDILQKDPDDECRKRAAQLLAFMSTLYDDIG